VDVLPDGCADLVWIGGALVVSGPDRASWRSVLAPGEAAVGVRIATGWAGAALGLPATELTGLRVAAEDLWGAPARALADRVASAPDARSRHEVLVGALAGRLRTAPADRAVLAAVAEVRDRGAVRVGDLARAAGIGERHLRRGFAAAVGYGPRTLTREARLQRFLAMTADGGPLARLAAAAGYADGPHLARETAALAGRTPAQLLAEWGAPGPERSRSGADGAGS
jgi:AraC-like DNA-binding protein